MLAPFGHALPRCRSRDAEAATALEELLALGDTSDSAARACAQLADLAGRRGDAVAKRNFLERALALELQARRAGAVAAPSFGMG